MVVNLQEIDPVQCHCRMRFSHYIGGLVLRTRVFLSLGTFFGPKFRKDYKKVTHIIRSNIFKIA